jgi:fatty acid desaturase
VNGPAGPNPPGSRIAPSAWEFWPRFLAFPLLAILLYPPFLLGWGGNHWSVRTAWVLLLTYCWFCLSGSFHEAVHGTLFRSVQANVFVGRIIGILCGVPYTAFRETHRRHHAYMNTAGDYELYPYSDPAVPLNARRVFVWFDLLLAVITEPWVYCRIYTTRDPKLSAASRRAILFEMILGWMWFAAVVTTVVLVFRSRGWTIRDFDPVWILPLVLSPVCNKARKFVEHLGLTSTDPLLGTRTISGGQPLSRLLRYFNFDIAVHGPHHRYPKAMHQELAPRLKQYCYDHPETRVPVFHSYLSAAWDALPWLWKNPATGSPASTSITATPSPTVPAAERVSGEHETPVW